jgi:hypothetical protein
LLKLWIVGLPPVRTQRDLLSIRDLTGQNGHTHAPLHISLIYPFVPGDVGQVEVGIRRVASAHQSFPVTLGECRILHDAQYAVCLMAEPKQIFRSIVQGLAGAIGVNHPHPEINPHATVALLQHPSDAEYTRQIVQGEIKRAKPKMTFTLSEIVLLGWGSTNSRWSVWRKFSLAHKG